jgi:signal transduction histidine kinase
MPDLNTQQLQERLKQAERALERSDRLAVAGLYAGVTMHEVNNPLEAITNLVYLTKLQKDDPRQVLENMLVIEGQLQTLGRITSQSLSFYREQQDARAFDLVEIAEASLRLHADTLMRHGVTLDRQLRGPAPARVFGNEILQVLSNLILNAVDAMPSGRGKLTMRVRTMGSLAHITVLDNGSGIPAAIASRLFAPYVTGKEFGTGIGVWLSHRIITKHQGTLRFKTCRKEGRSGTCFRVSLPIYRPALPAH